MYKVRGTDQKDYGPVSADILRRWIGEGRANAQTLVQAEGSADWKPLSAFPEFAGAFAQRTLPPVLPTTPPVLSSSVTSKPKQSGLAVASMVLGIVGFLTCGLTSLFGLITGIVSLVKIRNSKGQIEGSGFAIAGICTSGIALLMLPIMAGMALPAFAKAKNKAQSIRCINNVKQLSLAVRIYANDNNERYPAAKQWCDNITPFVGGSTEVFNCPLHQGQRCSYAFNQKLDGKKENEVDPSTVMIFESDLGWNADGDQDALITRPRHGQYTIGFADGHVEQVSASRLRQLRWDP
jgi:prepilin-type processing-associated H-X9-DG protein